MSSARKRSSIQKANSVTERLRQQLMMADHHIATIKAVAELMTVEIARLREIEKAASALVSLREDSEIFRTSCAELERLINAR